MQPAPLVSVVIPATDAVLAEATLRSCTDQTLRELEILWVVDAAEVDAGSTIRARDADPRVRVVTSSTGSATHSAHARGLREASAPMALLARAGDILPADALRAASDAGRTAGADLVVILDESAARELPAVMVDEDIMRHVFPESDPLPPAGTLFLLRTVLLRKACADAAVAAQVDVVPAAVFLAAAHATRATRILIPGLAATPTVNERRDFRTRAGSRLDALDAFTGVGHLVRQRARDVPNPEPLLEGFEAMRLALIAEAIRLLLLDGDATEALRLIEGRATALDLVLAASEFAREFLPALAQHGTRVELDRSPSRSILLTTNVLTTGGVSGVLLTQARFLADAGHRVTIATHRAGSDPAAAPAGVTVEHITATTPRDRLIQWAGICERHAVDTVIDHRILYSRDWPAYALTARALGAATIGWIHNFAGRPTYNGNDLHTLLQQHLGALTQLIVLSPLDVAFWKLRGIDHVAYLPNPPSPMLLDTPDDAAARTRPRGPVQLIWWGRLEEHTKKVSELIEVAAHLKALGTDFRLRIVGPDWTDMSRDRLNALADERGLSGLVEAVGPRRGDDLLAAIDAADVFVNTSIIEGYPLTLPEAQSRGLPIAMYDLPWLSLLDDNAGVVTVPQGDARGLAVAITDLAADGERYEAMSDAALAAARRAASADFGDLYAKLLTGSLPAELSPAPTLDDARQVLDLLLFFAENRAPRQTPATATTRRRPPASVRGRLERRLTPTAHRLLSLAPWLRPVAQRTKRALLR
ncbi:glycosyltransferase [Microbacterium sp.]|uniref:glycosyltransferase n=1 Tax=Microbacterium sp. TaxID=51671 RepID=UPI003735BD21